MRLQISACPRVPACTVSQIPNVSVIMGLYDIWMAVGVVITALGTTIYELVVNHTLGNFTSTQDGLISGLSILGPILAALAIVVDFFKR